MQSFFYLGHIFIVFYVKMAKSAYVTPAQRQRIIDLRKDDYSYGEIAKKLKLSKTACFQAAKYVQSTGSVQNKVRIRRRKTTARDDRKVHRLSEADRFKTAVDIHEELSGQLSKDVSVSTIKRRLNEFGLMGRIARKKPFIFKKNRKTRLEFAKEHVNWTEEQWSKVSKIFGFY